MYSLPQFSFHTIRLSSIPRATAWLLSVCSCLLYCILFSISCQPLTILYVLQQMERKREVRLIVKISGGIICNRIFCQHHMCMYLTLYTITLNTHTFPLSTSTSQISIFMSELIFLRNDEDTPKKYGVGAISN